MKLWLNGKLCNADEARIEPADRGFTLGDGIFETIRVVEQQPLRLEQHLQRMFHGAGILQIPLRYNEAAIAAAIVETLADNQLKNAALRLALTRGPAARGVLPQNAGSPTLLITCADLPPPKPPAKAITSTITRRNEHSPLSRIKSLNYLDNILALQDAVKRGADEAVLLNTIGHVAEATAANIFLICSDKTITPPIADGALPGIMRAAIIARFGAIEQSLTPVDMNTAGAAFLSNALGLRVIARVDNIMLDVQHPRFVEINEWVETSHE